MNRISPDKPPTPRMRPIGKSPRKSGLNDHSRLIKSQVEGEVEEGANLDNRSTTGSLGLNENPGTLVTPDQRHVAAQLDAFTSPLKKKFPKKEPANKKMPSATGYGPRASASSTATERIKSQ